MYRAMIVVLLVLVVLACAPPAADTPESASSSMSSGPTSSATTEPSQSVSTSPASTSGGADPCEQEVEVAQSDADQTPSGFVQCANGMLHRVEPVECVAAMPLSSCDEDEATGCLTDADCGDGDFGVCIATFNALGCACVYGCASDDDCPAGQACVCGADAPGYPAVNSCVPASCASDDDCPDTHCALGETDVCQARYQLECLTADDACVSQQECAEFEECGPHSPGEPWMCESVGTC